MTHKPLILSNDEIVEIITVQECMDIVEKLFVDLEDSQMPPKIYLDIPDGDFRAMPAVVGYTAGIKWCGGHLDKTNKKRMINFLRNLRRFSRQIKKTMTKT